MQPEYEHINAIPAARRALADVLRRMFEMPPGDPGAIQFWADSSIAIVDANEAIVDATLRLVDWWDANPRADAPAERVHAAMSAEELRRAVAAVQRDRIAPAFEYHRQAACELADAAGRAATDPGDDVKTLVEASNVRHNPMLKALLDKADNFGEYIDELGRDQYKDMWREAARHTPGGANIDWIEQTIMPDGGVVTTSAERFKSPPPPPPRKRAKKAKKRKR